VLLQYNTVMLLWQRFSAEKMSDNGMLMRNKAHVPFFAFLSFSNVKFTCFFNALSNVFLRTIVLSLTKRSFAFSMQKKSE
jgi:hypothetical protein